MAIEAADAGASEATDGTGVESGVAMSNVAGGAPGGDWTSMGRGGGGGGEGPIGVGVGAGRFGWKAMAGDLAFRPAGAGGCTVVGCVIECGVSWSSGGGILPAGAG